MAKNFPIKNIITYPSGRVEEKYTTSTTQQNKLEHDIAAAKKNGFAYKVETFYYHQYSEKKEKTNG